jgi:valyl-tRNA synthetase
VDDNGDVIHDEPLRAALDRLPVDPSADVPDGYTEDQRGRPGGFVADPDIMDTWATSSLTPQIAGRWIDDADLFSRVFPMDIRPQAHDIIRTWLFATVVRSHLQHDSLPWRSPTISGWILDPDRKKMSKSIGNVVTPMPLLEQYGSDAVRYWGLNARLGADTAFDESQMKIGRKLALKVLNASKFVLGFPPPPTEAAPAEPIDVAMLARLRRTVAEATAAFDEFDYARALERSEAFFWWFCDDYVELVKTRAYGSQGDAASASAGTALREALDVLLRLFAPFLPFVTDEVWSWWRDGSIHSAAWPAADEVSSQHEKAEAEMLLDTVCGVLALVRRAKTEAKASQRARVDHLVVRAPAAVHDLLGAATADLREAGSIAEIEVHDAAELTAEITLGTAPAAVRGQ